jgi:predicted DNA-binding WGR domain protein
MSAVTLHRIDPARNMSRFYQLGLQHDLFGGVLLMKEWGRIGARGRIMAEHYDTEALAAEALQRQAEWKRRRGYVAQAFNVHY